MTLSGHIALPLSFGTSRNEILSQFERELVDFAAKIRPQLVLISAGFDAHREDDLGQLGLVEADYRRGRSGPQLWQG